MNWFGKILIGIFILLAISFGVYYFMSIDRTGIEPQEDVDINKYIGTWNEIARFDHNYEKGCVCVEATYSPTDFDYVDVYNYCQKEDGSVEDIKGKAFLTEEEGRLKVQFYPFLKSDYKILYVDSYYQYALVGGNDMNTLWILSRSQNLNRGVLDDMLEKANSLGYDVEKFIFNEGC